MQQSVSMVEDFVSDVLAPHSAAEMCNEDAGVPVEESDDGIASVDGAKSKGGLGALQMPIVLEPGAVMPEYASEGASGLDLCAWIPEPVCIQPGQRTLIPTGVRVHVPIGYEAQVRPRSGLAWKQGLTVLNTPGTVDADYRGEIKVVLIHMGQDLFTIEPGMRIAQLVIAPVIKVQLKVVSDLAASDRGSGGFGSTGVGRLS